MEEKQTGMRMMMSRSVMVAVLVMACLVLSAAATGHAEVGDVGEYWQKRAQEARLRNHGGPLNDLVAAATRFHQALLHRSNSRRSVLLDDEARTQAASTPAHAEVTTVEGGDDHEVVQDPAIIRNK